MSITSPPKKTHRIARLTITDHTGTYDGGEVLIHVSRNCSNCSYDGLKDLDWLEGGGVEQFGRCTNVFSAADEADEANQWCHDHASAAEFRAGVHCPHMPVFALVQGGAA